jgi:hypothetical protein
MKKRPVIIAGILLLSASVTALFAQDEAVTITSPTPWMTLRSDSVVVSVQADTLRLPQRSIAFKVSKNSNGKTSALFSKTVKMDDVSADVFLGRLGALPLGGTDFLTVEWSVPGSELKGVIEPLGAVRLPDEVTARPPLSAARLKEGVTEAQVADILRGVGGTEAGGVRFAAGWNTDALYVLINAAEGVTEAQIAIDGKCGKSAFLSWADRFAVFSAASDSVYGRHYKRSVDKSVMKFDEMAWGGQSTLSVTKAEVSRLIKIRWYEVGIQTFEERNIGFAVFAANKAKKAAAYPGLANREIPGTWGDLKLEK